MSAASLRPRSSRTGIAGDQTAWDRAKSRLLQIWSGPADLPAHLRMEQRFIVVRYLGILCLAPTLLLLNLNPQRLAAAYALLLFTASYNFGVQVLLRRRSAWLNHGYVTTIGDGLLNIAMVTIGGGFASSFYFILFTTTIAAAMRYGYGPSLLVVAAYVTLDALAVLMSGVAPSAGRGDFFFRSGFLAITTVMAGYLREQARAAEAALARQLASASALNDSTRALSASLKLDTVVRTVALEARRLAEADESALQLGNELGGIAAYDIEGAELSSPRAHERRQVMDHLVKLTDGDDQPVVRRGWTDDQRPYMVVPLHARSGVPGRMALLRSRGGPPFRDADEELLCSFIDRSTLAIENASLYKTIGDRSCDLQRAYADLAAAHQELLGVDEMKTSFIANVSHELRTPLTSIRSFSEILLSFEVDDVTGREFLGIINAESERLTRLINDVLDITKIEAGQVDWHIESIDLIELLRSSARTFVSVAEDKGLRFELVPPIGSIRVRADVDRVLQVLANLLGNAMKFTTRGDIVLSAEVAGAEAHIHVRDTGVGIAPADHERIFEKFHQVGDTLTEKPTGTGLGLCICRDIITHLGGRIWLDSTLGRGSVFSFSLPLAPAHADEALHTGEGFGLQGEAPALNSN